MHTFILALIIMLIVVVIMAIGVLMGRKPIAGSCGGIPAALGENEEDYKCPVCGDDPSKCDEQQGALNQTEELESDSKSGDELFYSPAELGSRNSRPEK